PVPDLDDRRRQITDDLLLPLDDLELRAEILLDALALRDVERDPRDRGDLSLLVLERNGPLLQVGAVRLRRPVAPLPRERLLDPGPDVRVELEDAHAERLPRRDAGRRGILAFVDGDDPTAIDGPHAQREVLHEGAQELLLALAQRGLLDLRGHVSPEADHAHRRALLVSHDLMHPRTRDRAPVLAQAGPAPGHGAARAGLLPPGLAAVGPQDQAREALARHLLPGVPEYVLGAAIP